MMRYLAKRGLRGLPVIWLCAYTAMVLYTVAYAYSQLTYRSDGFHYYSALRNLATFGSFYEGPVMERMLGNHACVAFYLLTPLVMVFPTPLVLGVVLVLAFMLGAVFLSVLAWRVSHGHVRFVILCQLAYLLHPHVLGSITGCGVYLFQIDYLVIPCVFALALAIQSSRKVMAGVAMILFVLVKEDCILMAPIMAALFIWASGGRFVTWRFLAVVWFAASVLSMAVYLPMHMANEFHFTARHVSLAWLANPSQVIRWLSFSLWFALPLMILLPAGRWRPVLVALAIFVFGRVAFNLSIYNEMSPFWHWSLAVVVPVVLSTWVLSAPSSKAASVWLALSLVIVAAMPWTWTAAKDLVHKATYSLPSPVIAQCDALAALLPAPRSCREYSILPEPFHAPFMARSHLSLEILLTCPPERRRELCDNAYSMLLVRGDSRWDDPSMHSPHFKIIAVSEIFVLLINTNKPGLKGSIPLDFLPTNDADSIKAMLSSPGE